MDTSLAPTTPSIGKMAMGRRAVTAMGRASVSQYTAIINTP